MAFVLCHRLLGQSVSDSGRGCRGDGGREGGGRRRRVLSPIGQVPHRLDQKTHDPKGSARASRSLVKGLSWKSLESAAQERLVKALSEYERLAQLQYEGGYTPYSTVLQAQQELFPQQLNLAQDRYAVYNALVNLYKAMGGGWVDIAQQQADAPMQKNVTGAGGSTESATAVAARPQDRIEVSAGGDTSAAW